MTDPTTHSSWSIRPWRMLAAILLGIGVWLLIKAAEYGLTHDWPLWLKGVTGFMLPVGALCALVLFANGIGLLSSESLMSVGQGRSPTAGVWMMVYLGSMIALLAVNVFLVFVFHANWLRTMLIEAGLFFLIASSGRPWWLFGTIRRAGWFALVESDSSIRWFLAVVGLLTLLGGLFGKGLTA